MDEIKVSMFKDTFSKEVKVFSLVKLMQLVVTGHWKEKIEILRKLSKEEYNKQKVFLPAVTFSGTFTERKADKIEEYSKVMCIDIDYLQPDTINALKTKLADDDFVFFAFVSPSGNGLKVLVKINTEAQHHKTAFKHLEAYFSEKYEVQIDKSCKDVSRLCFVSSDEFAIIKDSKVFEVDLKYQEVHEVTKKFTNSAPVFDAAKIFDTCVKWVERTYKYTVGNRHVYCFSLACALNRCGVPYEEAIMFINGAFDLPEADLVHSTKSAYFRNRQEFGSVVVTSYGAIDDYAMPIYETKYDDDLIWNEIKRYVGMLYQYNLAKSEVLEITAMIAKYFNSTKLIDIQKKDLLTVINEAIDVFNANKADVSIKNSLKFFLAEDLGVDLLHINSDSSVISTGFIDFDDALRGGFQPLNSYAIIGTDKTYKSILAQFFAVTAVCKQNRPVLYFNGEMSKKQFYERLAAITLNVNLHDYIKTGSLTNENMPKFMQRIKEQTEENLYVVNGTGWTEDEILGTIDSIKKQTGKVIEMVILDGLTQMSWGKENEVMATSTNAAKTKEIAKKAHNGRGVVVIPLLHVSGENNKLFRDTGLRARGGVKTTSAFDGYFSTSLFEDAATEGNSNDIQYVKDKFYLRLVDKRGTGGVVSKIIKVPGNLRLELENGDPSLWETERGQSNR